MTQTITNLDRVTIEVTFPELPEPFSIESFVNGLRPLSVVVRVASLLEQDRSGRKPYDELRRFSYNSPVVAELVASGGAGYLLYWFVMRPRDVGRWLPRVVAGWREGWQSLRRDVKDTELGNEVQRLVDQSESPHDVLLRGGTADEIDEALQLDEIRQKLASRATDITPVVDTTADFLAVELEQLRRRLGEAEARILELRNDEIPPPNGLE